MTQPQAQGFPDWQRNTPAQNVIYSTFNGPLAGPLTLGPFFCGYSLATRLNVTATDKNSDYTLSWYPDKAMSNQLGVTSTVTQATDFIEQAYSNKGPWFTLRITALTYPLAASGLISAVTYVGGGTSLLLNGPLFSGENNALPASGSTSYFGSNPWPGPAVLNINCNQLPYTVSLAGLDLNGVRQPFFQYRSTAENSIVVPVNLPAAITRAIITNGTAVATTVSAYLLADPSTRPAR